MSPKDADEIANGVDPDQTALICGFTVCTDLSGPVCKKKCINNVNW